MKPQIKLGSTRNTRGLTMPEMLTVVAVFTVLAIMFIMSYERARIKTLVSRVRQDQRVLAGAISSYQAEYLALPSSEAGLLDLLTPRTPLTIMPVDPFSREGPIPYHYFLYPGGYDGSIHWVLVSAGPDGDIDFDAFGVGNTMDGASDARPDGGSLLPWPTLVLEEIILKTYDPTNGAASDGDIFRFE